MHEANTTLAVTGPRIWARVQLQYWDAHDNAVDAAKPIHLDVTEHVNALPAAERAALKDNDDTSDNVYLAAVVAGQTPAHNGPFYVELADSLTQYDLTTDPAGTLNRLAQRLNITATELDVWVTGKALFDAAGLQDVAGVLQVTAQLASEGVPAQIAWLLARECYEPEDVAYLLEALPGAR